jgi:alkanesulfonate monooxygenase
VFFRPILAATEAKAWERARAILARVLETAKPIVGEGPGIRPEAEGARRLVEFARRGEVHDRRLWMPIAAAMGGAGNTSALVGTPEQVAEALLAYHDVGVTTFLIRGFDPLNDAIDYGRELIPMVRAEIARRDRAAAATA